MISNELQVIKLGEILPQPYKNGIYKHIDSYGSGTPIIRITDFDNDGNLVTKELSKVHITSNEVESYLLKLNDIVINRVNSLTHIGKSILWTDEKNVKTVYESNMMRIQSDSNRILPQYLISVLQSEPAREHFRKVAKRAVAQSSINQQDVKSLKFMLPPLFEQKKIAQILSTWDKAITTSEQLLANSQQQKKALMQQILTGKERLLDDNGVRFSGEWKKGKLGDIANIDSGYAFKSTDFTDSENGIPIIRMSDFKAGGIDISNAAKVIPETTIGLDRFKLKTGDFVFGMSGSLSNYGWVKEQDLPCFLNQRVGRILAKECAVQLFVTYLYLSDKIQQSILDKAAGAAQLNISSTDLRMTIVHYPSYEEQQKIAAVLSTADQEITALKQKLDALKQEKKALMQQLLTGKRRVKTD